MTARDFDVALASYVARLQGKIDRTYKATVLRVADAPKVIATGGKNVRVVLDRGGKLSVHSFVRRDTGDLLRASSWEKPAQKVLGSIYDDAPESGAGVLGFSPVRATKLVVEGAKSPIAD